MSKLSELPIAELTRTFFDVATSAGEVAEKREKCDIIADTVRKLFGVVSVTDGTEPGDYEPLLDAGTLPAVATAWNSESRVSLEWVDQYKSCRFVLGGGHKDGSNDYRFCSLATGECTRSTHKGKSSFRQSLATGRYGLFMVAPSTHGPQVFSRPCLEWFSYNK
jgi:hypothetical protein